MCPEIDWKSLEEGFRMLAWWSVENPRPEPPELIPGLPGVNANIMLAYRERLVAWKAGRAERLMYGLRQ